jgi:hypothetical protein
MVALGKAILTIAKKVAVDKVTSKDKDGNSGLLVVAGIVLGFIFLVTAFLQYLVENPIDALRIYFSDDEIETVENFKKSEDLKNTEIYPVPLTVLDEKLLMSFGSNIVLANKLIAESYKHLGKPYVWGANGPNSFDCSGFVAYCLRNSKVQQVDPRPTCRTLWAGDIEHVKRGEERPGDLIFFQGTQGFIGASHVGIYLGNNKFIEANSRYLTIMVSKSNEPWAMKHFYGFGRPKALVDDVEIKTTTSEDSINKQEEVKKEKDGRDDKKDNKSHNKKDKSKKKDGKDKGKKGKGKK